MRQTWYELRIARNPKIIKATLGEPDGSGFGTVRLVSCGDNDDLLRFGVQDLVAQLDRVWTIGTV